MIIDDVTDCLIQRTLDDGGKVWAFNQTEKFEVLSAGNGQITIDSGSYEFSVGDKISFIYEPNYKTPYCFDYTDTDGDGIIDLVDLDADGDGQIDPRKPFDPSHVVTEILTLANAPSLVTIITTPYVPSVVRSRIYGEALIVDGYYPIYLTYEEAYAASPLAEPDVHEHIIDERTYYMPEGVDLWHGDYFTCPPKTPINCTGNAVNTYDFEYVDRVIHEKKFSSIIPYNYLDQLLGIDTDENGSFETIANYSLNSTYNIFDQLNADGEIEVPGDLRFTHYDTTPKQSWVYVVTDKDTSENVLEAGHSFGQGNYVIYGRTFTKFDPSTDDALNHTKSIFKYYSTLANGNRALFTASASASIIYHDYETDEWVKDSILEINSDGYIVLDKDIFQVADKFYIYVESFPNAPSQVQVSVENKPDIPTFVTASIQPEVPTAPDVPSNIVVSLTIAPSQPLSVSAEIAYLDQDIVWQQFEEDFDTALVEAENYSINANYDFGFAIAPSNINAEFADFVNNSINLKMVAVESGAKLNYYDGFIVKPISAPIRDVLLAQNLVTNSQYNQVMSGNSEGIDPQPSVRGNRANAPVDNVSYNDAMKFCEIFTAQERAAGRLPSGYIYSLPTSSEWEYFYSQNDYYPFAVGNSGISEETVRQYGQILYQYDGVNPNPQLYDVTSGSNLQTSSGINSMIGHVYEHVIDRGYIPLHQEYYGATAVNSDIFSPVTEAFANSLSQYSVRIQDRGIKRQNPTDKSIRVINQAPTWQDVNPVAYMEDTVTITRGGVTNSYTPKFTGYKGFGQVGYKDYHPDLMLGLLRRNNVGCLSTGNFSSYGLDDTFYGKKWQFDYLGDTESDPSNTYGSWLGRKGMRDYLVNAGNTLQDIVNNPPNEVYATGYLLGMQDLVMSVGTKQGGRDIYHNVFDRQVANTNFAQISYFNGIPKTYHDYHITKYWKQMPYAPFWSFDRMTIPYLAQWDGSNEITEDKMTVLPTGVMWHGNPYKFNSDNMKLFRKADGTSFDTEIEALMPNFGLRICLVKESHRQFLNQTSRTINYEY